MDLYKLERMKIRLSTYMWAIFGISMSLLALGILFLFIFEIAIRQGNSPEEMELFDNWNGLLALITALTFACFSILSAVIAAQVIVKEYCGKNAVIILSYPINRNVMLNAKCLIVCAITVISACVSNAFILGCMYVTAKLFTITPLLRSHHFIITVLIVSVFAGIACSAVGMISAVIGWKKRSGVAAIVCSLIVVCLMTNCITISPTHIIWSVLIMSVLLVVIAAILYHKLAREIEEMEV